jgi:hypothetical protein
MKEILTNIKKIIDKKEDEKLFYNIHYDNIEKEYKISNINFLSDLKNNDIVVHKNGELYEIIDLNVEIQIDDDWKQAILYKKFFSQNNMVKYVRNFDEFKTKFKKLSKQK